MTKKVTKFGLRFLGKPAPLWLQKLLASWMVIAAATKTWMLTVGFSDQITSNVDATFIYTGALLAVFFPITGSETKQI